MSTTVFMQHAQKLTSIVSNIMPLNIQKYVLHYDAMHASLSSTVKKLAKWTCFWILQVFPNNKQGSCRTYIR